VSQPPPQPQPGSPHLAHSLAQSSQGSSASGWRSEEDYFLARLAVRLGYLDNNGVQGALARQGQLLAAGQALTLGQLLVREGGLPPQALIHLQHELSRCHHGCPACGAGNWHAPGPQPRHEQCRHCGAPLPVAAAGSSLSGSFVRNRLSAVDHGTQRFHHDPLQQGSTEGPRLFANYLLDQQLAKGGMGAIYRVRHAETGQVFALKVLLAAEKASEGQIHRFKREAKAQIELGDHPNIVKIHDAGEWEGILYYAMDLIEGTDLGASKAGMSRDERIKCMAKLGRAVQYAHEQGYLHRDLKPANVLLDKNHQPLITDFGLAKNLSGDTRLTKEGAAMGTPFYMAPEQAVGKLEAMGPCSDVYSLGVILYELICGDVPFRADSTVELYRMILELAPAPFAAHDVMEPELELVAFKAMEKEPEHRYATALEFAEDLERVLAGEKPSASSVSSAERLSRKVEENKRSIGFILGSVVASLVLLIVVALGAKLALRSYRKSQAATQREEAARNASAALGRAVDLLETARPEDALAGLDEALDQAALAAEGEGTPPKGLPDLQQAWRPALLARARVAVVRGQGHEGRRAAACLEAFDAAGEASPEQLLEAAELRVRVAWRLGDPERARALLEAPPLKDSQAPLAKALRVDALLSAGLPQEALTLAKSLGARDPARFLRVRCLLALGERAKATAEVQKLFARGSTYRGPWTRALIAAGDLPAAFASARDDLVETAHPGAARRAVALALALGRDHEALLAIERALKRAVGDSTLNALRLRLQVRLGRDISKPLAEAADHPELRLLRLDWAALQGQPAPKSSTEDVTLVTAAAARDPKAELPDPARALLDDIPHDRPPRPALGRSLRDLGRALVARGEAEQAQRAAAGAWRGLRDLDSALLGLETAKPAQRSDWVARVGSATVAELSNLQGPLARGVLCARWPGAFGANEAPTAAAFAEANSLLRARQLAGPNPVADHYLQRAREPLPAKLPTLPGGVSWEELIPEAPLRASVSAADRAAAIKEADVASALPRSKNHESEQACQQILGKDPWNYLAQWELGVRRARYEGPGGSAGHLYLRRIRLRPGRALHAFWQFRGDWIRGFMATAAVPGETIDGVRSGTIASTDITKVDCTAAEAVVYTLALTYPDDARPAWPKGPSRPGIRAMVGDALRRDPLYLGLLYLEAFHLAHEEGLGPAATRNLELLESLVLESLRNRANTPIPYEHSIFKAWIRSPYDPNAGEELAGVKLEPVGKDFKVLLAEWISEHSPEKLRKHPSWTAFARKARTE
jgi:serine/threonine protein kinase